MKLGATRVVRKHWRAGAMKFLAEIMVERESLDQLDREERGIEDEVKLEEGERVRCGRERERERGSRRKGGREERKDQSIVNVSAAPPDPTGQNTALGLQLIR